MYTIGQISEMFNIPISTLRYYDKEGLFPDMERKSGIRKFSEREVDALRAIECLKASGLEIKDIKLFMELCTGGSSTFVQRRQLFESRKKAVEDEIRQLQRTLDILKFKCWYYDTAITDGNEERLQEMLPDHLPPEIQKLYDSGHSSLTRGESVRDEP